MASLGNAPIERADWKPIAKAVEDRLYAREALLDRTLSAAQTHWVDRIVRQVGNEGRWWPLVLAPANEEILDGVRADAVSHTDTAELGPVLLEWEIWKRLGMPPLLQTLGFNRSQSQAAAISVINRLANPTRVCARIIRKPSVVRTNRSATTVRRLSWAWYSTNMGSR